MAVIYKCPRYCQLLAEVEDRWWEGEISVPYAQFPFTFKYAVRSHAQQEASFPGARAAARARSSMTHVIE